jgi:hypothetical protein
MLEMAFASADFPAIRSRLKRACLGLGLAFLGAATSSAQAHPAPGLPTLPSGVPANAREDYDIPSNDPAEQQRRLRALNVERQKRVVSDSNKLLKLTTELNAEVAQSSFDSLTPTQLRKLAEIERLARDLKEKMKMVELPSTDVRTPLDPRLR